MKRISFKGRFEVWWEDDAGKTHRFFIDNLLTTEGLNYLLNAGVHGDAQTFPWKIGLIADSGFTEITAADTMASHSGWVESTAYSEAARPSWGNGAAAGGITLNTTAIVFSMTATTILRGLFVSSSATKGGATGTLLAAGQFDAGKQTIPNSRKVNATYSLQATSG